ncbi:MAG: PEP-CTERM sorting domain-containing protein [Vulcanimicrobiaceae bacterium]
MSAWTRLFASIALLVVSKTAWPAPIFNVSFNDPGGMFASFYPSILSHVQAAGSDWGKFIASNASLDVSVSFQTNPAITPLSTGRSFVSVPIGTRAGAVLLQDGAVYELRTGTDPNGSSADIDLVFGANYLANELWFDPNPFTRSAPVPSTKTDAMSVVLHELGHALGFNGFLNLFTGANSGFLSTYDQWVSFDGNFFFNGPTAEQIYGGPVPLTFCCLNNTYHHLGNFPPRPGFDLIDDLMNGLFFFRGERYDVSPLDVAILADVGVPINAVPEPSTVMLLAIGLFALVGLHWKARAFNLLVPSS